MNHADVLDLRNEPFGMILQMVDHALFADNFVLAFGVEAEFVADLLMNDTVFVDLIPHSPRTIL